ncbi:MAG: hypothetical protein JRF58_06725 [Deltaproteobacteria bacterium]|nr:hypothetical protein [Deltaproteobacteria bacterium]
MLCKRSFGDLCKTPLFVQFLRQAQIVILEIRHVFLWLKSSPSLNLNKNEHFSKVSLARVLPSARNLLSVNTIKNGVDIPYIIL